MRKFSSYGPLDKEIHYYAPRNGLIERAYNQLIGEHPARGGHYITVWGPRQTGKTWVMQEVAQKIRQTNQFEVGIFSIESLKKETEETEIISLFVHKMAEAFQKAFPPIRKIRDMGLLFTKQCFQKPVILIIDEFDSMEEELINDVVSIFRNIFISRSNERERSTQDKTYLLHSLALVGVRSVLGIENITGSPFNVQRSLPIPNLSLEEVDGLFKWYEQESGQAVDRAVSQRLYAETRGQPGLTCWFGELLTEGFEGYPVDREQPIGKREFDIVYAAATYALPNNNILNMISKAKQESHKRLIFQMFQTDEKLEFRFDDSRINALYMHGIVDKEVVDQTRYYLAFSSPFVQKRLFHYFANELFQELGTLVEPFESLENVITEDHLDIRNLMKLYQKYLKRNKAWLFRDAPRRSDLKIYEAVFHFNLFAYMNEFLRSKGGRVFPEFPTGNGQIDLIIRYRDKVYGIELKSYTDQPGYRSAQKQAARYGQQLQLTEIFLVTFVEAIDEPTRKIHEVEYLDPETHVTVIPLFIETGTTSS